MAQRVRGFYAQHACCSWVVPIIPSETEPRADPRLIKGKPELHQSVISFLYGISLDDKMSGKTQALEVAVATRTWQ